MEAFRSRYSGPIGGESFSFPPVHSRPPRSTDLQDDFKGGQEHILVVHAGGYHADRFIHATEAVAHHLIKASATIKGEGPTSKCSLMLRSPPQGSLDGALPGLYWTRSRDKELLKSAERGTSSSLSLSTAPQGGIVAFRPAQHTRSYA